MSSLKQHIVWAQGCSVALVVNYTAQAVHEVPLNCGFIFPSFSVTLALRQRGWCTAGKSGGRAGWWATGTQLPRTTAWAKSAAPPGDPRAAVGLKQAQDNTRESWHTSDRGFIRREGWRARDSLQHIKQLASGIFSLWIVLIVPNRKLRLLMILFLIRGFI